MLHLVRLRVMLQSPITRLAHLAGFFVSRHQMWRARSRGRLLEKFLCSVPPDAAVSVVAVHLLGIRLEVCRLCGSFGCRIPVGPQGTLSPVVLALFLKTRSLRRVGMVNPNVFNLIAASGLERCAAVL